MYRQQPANSMPTFPNNCPTFSTTLLSKQHEINNVEHGDHTFITRKRSFYLLTSLLVIGIAILIFITVGGILAYVQYAQQATRGGIAAFKTKICEPTYCSFGAKCIVDENGDPFCRCDDDCPIEYSPVCGSDSMTYQNECQLKLRACSQQTHIDVISKGTCDPCLFCPKSRSPVCGSDGTTYHNDCQLKCQSKAKLIHSGPCQPCEKMQCQSPQQCYTEDGISKCTCPQCSDDLYEPVCGTDGSTYNTSCHVLRHNCLHDDKVVIIHEGKCSEKDDECIGCHPYSQCEINRKEGRKQCVCPQVCIRVDKPVCGSNGVTYESECELKMAACRSNTHITVKFNGSCELCNNVHCKYGAKCQQGTCVCPTECPVQLFEPVCADDGITYNNECLMRAASCKKEKNLKIVFYGECDEGDQEEDEQGSGVELAAPGIGLCENVHCKFGAKCKIDKEENSYCTCDNFDCTAERKNKHAKNEVICGSDGKTYKSLCDLQEERCRKQQEIRQDIEGLMCQNNQPISSSTFSFDSLPLCPSLPLQDSSECSSCPINAFCYQGTCCTLDEINCSTNKCNNNGKFNSNDNEGPEYSCQCNKHGSHSSDDCDPITKQCRCKNGVGGLHCDRCEAGFWGLHTGNNGCTTCACHEFGSVRRDCEQMTGRCVCKIGIIGTKCDKCEQNDLVLTERGCVSPEIAKPSSKTCKEMTCLFGSKCVSNGRGSLCVCEMECEEEERKEPVCGSDGKLYQSECHLLVHQCQTQREIKIVKSCEGKMKRSL